MDLTTASQTEIGQAIEKEIQGIFSGFKQFSANAYDDSDGYMKAIEKIVADKNATPEKLALMLLDATHGRELDTSGLSSEVLLLLPLGVPPNSKSKAGLQVYLASLLGGILCVSAMADVSNEKFSTAIESVSAASKWCGFFLGNISGFNLNNEIGESARKKALQRHSSSEGSRLKVFSWCEENMDRFSSMDGAAFDIAETFVPQKFRTVRGWMTAWKKLQPASTP